MEKLQKIVIVGAGFVGMSYAYALLNQGIGETIVVIDINTERAEGEVMDLNHGLPFASKRINIYRGTYSECDMADLVVITAGAPQNDGETRLDLFKKNIPIVKQIVSEVKKTNFQGVYLVASNPVDLLSYVVFKEAGVPSNRVIGSGTVLDTARLRYEISKKIHIDSKNIHAYVLGEHGDSEFVCWSNASVGVKPLLEVIAHNEEISLKDMEDIYLMVKNSAYEVIKKKKATYYGIGMALARITKIILSNEEGILPVSTYMNNEYGIENLYISVPVVLGSNGVLDMIVLTLSDEEKEELIKSAKILREYLIDVGY